MPVISNSSPLIALTQIGQLDLLRRLYTCICVPPAVAREVEPTVARLPDWVLVQELAHPLQPGTVSASIGPGEREVISLGLESGAALLILDEQPARRLATSLELRVIGTVGILMAGKERGFLAKIRPELDRLLAVRFFMDQDLYDRVIAQAGVILKLLPTGGKAPGDPRGAALCRNRRITGGNSWNLRNCSWLSEVPAVARR